MSFGKRLIVGLVLLEEPPKSIGLKNSHKNSQGNTSMNEFKVLYCQVINSVIDEVSDMVGALLFPALLLFRNNDLSGAVWEMESHYAPKGPTINFLFSSFLY
ncbi:hypothetical protein HPP92_015087 [Vanilla planifolia]|uniref:Uncharacterized protein n=1 Tax=Vanilla planifolia TaxID=51239 RepID=A0A835UUS1_VANPL|nr:hypothetical protein HPP92_015087 [Vanilla planifolia]